MKQFLLTLLCVLVFENSSIAQKSFYVTNPISIAMLLVDDSNQERMEDICRYYNLVEISREGAYSEFMLTDGSTIKFKVENQENSPVKIPIIEITLANKKLNASDIFTKSGYRKTMTARGLCTYERGSAFANRHTICIQTSAHSYTFTKSVALDAMTID